MKLDARLLRRGMRWWPPFLGAGIRVRSFADDFRDVVVELKLGRFNRNYVGTHYGGSLYSMTDPFYMPEFDIDIVDEAGTVVARVRKTVYVRLKQRHRPQ